MNNTTRTKERGYTIIWIFYAFDIVVTIFALYLQWWVVARSFDVAQMNYQLAISGAYYTALIPFTVEFTALSIVIGSLQAAFAVIATAQYKKKMQNNTFQYMEEYVDKWLVDERTAPYAAQIFQMFLQTNQNN